MIKYLLKHFVFCLILLISSLSALHAQTCSTITSNTTPDAGYNQVYWVTSTSDANTSGTLRWAITQANANSGSGSMIKFCFDVTPGTDVVIQLTSQLPVIVKKVKIDGTVKGTANMIVLKGMTNSNWSSNAPEIPVLQLGAGSSNSIITGLTFGYGMTGIYLSCNGISTTYITNVYITNNIFYSTNKGIYLSNNINNIYIYSNKFGIDKSNNLVPCSLTACVEAIHMEHYFIGSGTPDKTGKMYNINIGSSDVNNSNMFYSQGYNLSIFATRTQQLAVMNKILIGKNIFYPGNLFNFTKSPSPYPVNDDKSTPTISNYDKVTNVLSGTSAPNDHITVYLGQQNTNHSASAIILLGEVTADASGNWSLPKSSWVNPSQPIVDFDEFNAIADYQGNSSQFATPYVIRFCPILDFNLQTVICKNSGTTIPLTGTPTGGTFSGSGVTGSTFDPANVTSGLINITYTYTSVPPGQGCSTTLTKQILVPPLATLLKNVISISATTATDAWPVDGTILSPTNGYGVSGIKFMWAPEEDYTYVDDRVQTNTLQTRTDGLLQNVPMFNWKMTSANSCYANWRKTNTITQVNSGTGQLENRDILNNYSAAIYGYNDQLATAVAANASYKEIAFESFEEYAVGADLKLVPLPKSNLTIVTGTPGSTSLAQETNFEYDIIEARDNVVTIKYPYSSFSLLAGKRVGVFGAYLTDNSTKNIHGYYDVQKAIAGTVAGTVVITLTDCAILGLWNGKMAIPSKISETSQPAIFTVPTNSSKIEKTFAAGIQRKAHSGKQFLKITANTEMEQVSLKLTPSKKYVISAWVSADVADANTYASGTDRRIEIAFLDASGFVISPGVATDYMFVPSGLIIEGWQRLEGFVTVPANAVRFTLKFITPTGAVTYFDDIRFFPFDGNMETYVYDNVNYKLVSVLDQNNYATYYYYDEEGALYLVKKETELGVQTIQEVYKHSTEINK